MDNELYHHGVKGQRWGVRRYQNSDGSLTYAGKKRALKMQDRYTNFTEDKKYRNKDGSYTYAGRKKALKMKEKYSELTGKDLKKYPPVKRSSIVKGKKTSKEKIDVKSLSDEDLEKKIKRLRNEKDYIDLNKQMASLNPKEVSKGKQFINKVANDMIVPAATDVGKQVVKSFMTKAANKAFNLDDELKVYTNNKKK